MFKFSEIKKSFLIALWFMFLTFPIMVIRVNTIYNTIEWRWGRMAMVGVGAFLISFLWRFLMKRKELGKKKTETGEETHVSLFRRLLSDKKISIPV
ncbi:MAG: branched-chain amino acid ABC transporter permease, partial [Deltaproteobacteria bacterium]